MFFLRQSTAITEKIGPFLDDADGKTPETVLTIAQADVRLSKNGGAYAQKNEATSCTHDENGEYGCPLNVTDTGTVGRLKLAVFESGALPVWHEYTVLSQAVYDELFKNAAAGMQGVIVANNLDHLMKVACGADDVVNNAALAKIVSKDAIADWSDFNNVTDSLEALYDFIESETTEIIIGVAALASVAGALDDAAAAGEVTEADTLMQYLKQLINILIGTPGIGAFPAEAAPANAVSLAEVIRAIYEDTHDAASGSRFVHHHTVIKKTKTNVTLRVLLKDLSGNPKTSQTITDLDIYYIRVETDNDVTISAKADLTALASLTAAHADNKGYEIGQGYYRIDVPDAAFATGAYRGTVIIKDGAGTPAISPTMVDFELVDHVLLTAGALEITYTMKINDEDTGDPLEGVEIFIATDSGGSNVIWSGTTDASGVLREAGGSKPWLDAGTYYFFRKKSGYEFDNPDTETFS